MPGTQRPTRQRTTRQKDRSTQTRASSTVLRAAAAGGQVLLEQQPQQGIWGGLWNPPERSAETSVEAFLNSQGVQDSDVTQVQYKEGFRHTFSHFHLDIEPIYIELKKAAVDDGARKHSAMGTACSTYRKRGNHRAFRCGTKIVGRLIEPPAKAGATRYTERFTNTSLI